MPPKEDRTMPANTVVIQGVVKPDGTLELEGKVPLPAGKVTVTLQPVTQVPYSQENDPFFQMLWSIRAAREQAGLRPRTREEIDAQVREIRDAFDEGVEKAGQLQEECRLRREAAARPQQESP
jgi:hypothetical protein